MDKDGRRSDPAARVELVECPRDAFQGFATPIPTPRKVAHLRTLVAAGFRAIDFGSFVAPKSVPQMADTEEVYRALEAAGATGSVARGATGGVDWIGIVANERGLERLLALPGVTTAGFPFSCSNTFQERNTGASIAATWPRLDALVAATRAGGRKLKVYLSMAFGNPFGDPWSPQLVVDMAQQMIDRGVTILLLADTVGTAAPDAVASLCREVGGRARGLTFGVHLHARADDFVPKVDAALDAGCRLFDSALGGMGGCPFAGDDLVGNLATELLIEHLTRRGFDPGLAPPSTTSPDPAAARGRLAAASASAAAIVAEFARAPAKSPSAPG